MSANAFQFQGFDATTELFRGPVRPKKAPSSPSGSSGSGGNVGAFLKQAARVARKSPEVMVRITGAAKGSNHVKEHLAYITRNGKLEAVNERGERIEGREAVKDLAGEWLNGGPKDRKGRAPDTRNLIFSMPGGTDPDKVLRAVKTFADKTFGGERAYVLVLHTPELDAQTKGAHPHVHLTLKTRGFDGKNLHPRKADLQAWREGFAHELRALDVSAEATPRRARGVVQKGKTQAVYHMERGRQDGNTSRTSAVQLAKIAEAVREISGTEPPKVRPWELKLADKQVQIRGAWLATAKVLDKHPDQVARKLADQIRTFVADMPPVQTERQAIHQRLGKSRGQEAGRS